MSWLDLRIPPPIVLLLTGALMAVQTWAWPIEPWRVPGQAGAAMALALLGVGVALAGVRSFHRAQTTASPLKPERATALVTTGLYAHTRNPMYLGLLLVLAGWGVWLGDAAALLGLPLFAAYLTRFQIRPEERALHALFDPAFAAYTAQVRRWL